MKNKSALTRIALIWLGGVTGVAAFLVAREMYWTLTESPSGQQSPPINYYIATAFVLVFLSGISAASLFMLSFPELLDQLVVSKDPRLCQHCGYDLTGSKQDKQIRCPECGEEIPYEDQK
jgi:predicted RNA-binding Zn-ribbon protein involved in translation (DUF1610 family)